MDFVNGINLGRYDKLVALAGSKGTDWTDAQTQLEFMWSELTGSYIKVYNVLMEATDLRYVTYYFARYYEVCTTQNNIDIAYSKNSGEVANRYEYAQKWYAQWEQKHTN